MMMKDMNYSIATEKMLEEWEKCREMGITYYPHVSLGWDPNPRFKQLNPDVIPPAKPEEIEKAFSYAKEYVDKHNENAPLIVVNSWNEWTEGSYFEPDNINGYGYLEAAKKVFCK
jgi:hypothetical protein